MNSVIIGLYLLGLVLISFEFVVPGGILGVLGGVAIFGSWGVAFTVHGLEGGMLAVLLGILVLGLTLFAELKLLPRTRVGRKLFLERAIEATSQEPLATPALVGLEGEALTTLAPTGVVVVEGQKYEAFSLDGLVEPGTRVQVVDFDNFRVRVKKI